ncbi:MAG: AAA family ATPase [Clostridia bacterium]|nr:AAA family ATPase [Clostridia bacterium]
MKINKIYISSFGKFKNYTLDLTDGFNIVYGENENGKSTLMSFVKMMFYGSGRGSSQISKNIRLKYTPWSGERAAGRIFFEHNGINYCLEREFLKSDNSDKVKLINSDTGESKVVGPSVGSDFFGISAAAFERTVFIGQTGGIVPDEEANGEINSKLSNIALTGDEDTSYQTVAKRLNDAKLDIISKSGKAGKYDKGKLRLEELKTKLILSEDKEQRKSKLSGRIEEIKEEISSLVGKYSETKKIVDSENDIRNRIKLEEYLNQKAELDKLYTQNSLSNGSIADETFVKKVEFQLSLTDNALLRVKERTEEIEKLKESLALAEKADSDEIKNQQAELEAELKQEKTEYEATTAKIAKLESSLSTANKEKADAIKKRKPFSPVLLIIGLLVLVCGVVLFVFSDNLILLLTSILGLIVSISSFIFRPLDKKAVTKADKTINLLQNAIFNIKTKESELSRKILNNTEKLNSLLSAINSDKAIIAQRKADLEAQTVKLYEEEEKLKETETELLKVFSLYKTVASAEEVKMLLPEILSSAEKQKQIKLKLKYLSDDLGGISYETAQQKLKEISENTTDICSDFEEKKQELEKINQRITDLKAEYSAITAELKSAYKDYASPDEIKKEIDSLTVKLQSQKHFCDVATVAARVLETSFIEVRRSYGSALEKKALNIFSRLTNGKYANVNISKSLEIAVEEADNFGTREIDYLSNGTVDQAYLSLRLALSELITDKEKLPVLLDDVLTQYDDKRAETAIEFLKEYSKNSQIVMFTCHKSLCNIAENYGIKSINI